MRSKYRQSKKQLKFKSPLYTHFPFFRLKKLIYKILFPIILSISIIVTAIFIYGKVPQYPKSTDRETPSLETFGTSFSPTPTSVTLQNSKLRNFSINDYFFEKEKYPSKLTSLQDSKLRSFSCSEEYRLEGNGKYTSYNTATSTRKSLTDSRLLLYLERISKKPNITYPKDHFFSSIQYCDIDNGVSLFFYRVGPCGGGCDGIQHVAQMSKTAEVIYDNEIWPGVEGVPYFGCELLATTKDTGYNMYLLCKGEAYASIENLDIKSGAHSSIKRCRYQNMDPTASYQCWDQSRESWKSYTDPTYGYSLQYPPDWTLEQEKDSEGYERIKLTRKSAFKATFSTRLLPQLFITMFSPYSTSGAVCANQGCEIIPKPLNVTMDGKNLSIPVTQGLVKQGDSMKFDFLAFTFEIPGKTFPLQGYSSPLNAVASYRNISEETIISEILSTLIFN